MTAEEIFPESSADIINKNKKTWKPLNWMCFVFALVPILSFIVFSGFPLVISFISMFTDIDNNMLDTMKWNSFQTIVDVFTDDRFWGAWGTTFILATGQLVSFVIALIIAVLLNRAKRGAKVMRVLFFMPYICSTVAIAIMWQWVFSKDFGILNAILGSKIDWLEDVDHSYRLVIAVYVTIIWSAPAYGIIMFSAALKGINPSYYEAASIDGAGSFRQFWTITLPGIKSVALFLLIAGVQSGLAVFDAVLVFAPLSWTGIAGPNDAGLTIMYYIYITGVQQGEMEYAAVMSWVLFVVIFLINFPIIRARNKASEEVW